jgi:hypothetical protein
MPCLTWPRCGYPAQDCILQHPQIDELTTMRRTQRPPTLSFLTFPHSLCNPIKHGIYGIGQASPKGVTFASNVTPVTFIEPKNDSLDSGPLPPTHSPLPPALALRLWLPLHASAAPQASAGELFARLPHYFTRSCIHMLSHWSNRVLETRCPLACRHLSGRANNTR